MGLNAGWDSGPLLGRRFFYLTLAAVAIFLLLLMRLWYLQVISHDRYLKLSEKNRIRYIPVTAERGPIYDRDGVLLVDNRPSFEITALRQDIDNPAQLLDRLSHYLPVDRNELQRRWDKGKQLPRYRPILLANDVDRDVMDQIQEHTLELPGVLTDVRPIRSYVEGEMAAHLFGYLGEITEAELEELEPQGYKPGDFVGKSGLEKKLEEELRGTDGERLLEVDVRGKELRILNTREPIPGNKVYLTLQNDLQLATEQAFGDLAGAAVVLDVRTGEVLAMVSRPAFNPAKFARGITGKEWIELLQNPRHPLQNKAIRGQYPPGSTFKIVTALAALQSGAVTRNTSVDCSGSITIGNREFRCWKREGHGETDLKKALRESCDVWFYQAAMETGIDRISQMAFDLGLGSTLDFILAGEKSGLIPTRDWKRAVYKDRWYDGETVIAAIGQGYVLATPLQLAVMTAAVANGGEVLRPRVLERIESLSGETLFSGEKELLRKVDFDPQRLAEVKKGLEAVVNEPHGTGWASKLPSVRVAGKTGTAQVVRRKSKAEEEAAVGEDDTPYKFRDHALFVAYAPADDPQIAVAVVVEHGRHGSSTAVPIARAVFENYFHVAPARDLANPGYLGD
jgi:penicillin-binding protein 2